MSEEAVHPLFLPLFIGLFRVFFFFGPLSFTFSGFNFFPFDRVDTFGSQIKIPIWIMHVH
jgi:hypothetical protein